MNIEKLKELLQEVRDGSIDLPEAIEALKHLPFADMGFATIDTHRSLRRGFPEVVYGEGKSAEQITMIMQRQVSNGENVLVTRISDEKAASVMKAVKGAEHNATARTLFARTHEVELTGRGTILVISAGTSDMPVAEEAAITAECMGNRVERLFDVGVAGIHRLLAHAERIQDAAVLIVVAGMEGALPSVVAGLVDRPVVAVPTSVGYGANLGGLTTMLAMLNSCASGVTVVNIDNGYGAAHAATLMNRDLTSKR